MTLKDFFEQYPACAIAFSGGVDSAYLLYAAAKYAEKVKAYFVKSAFQPEFERQDALGLAKDVGAEMEIIEADILGNANVAANPPDRCYHCKQAIFTQIISHARADGFHVILDGTNASDEEGDRPGMRALREMQVRSPLRLCGLTKDDIRRLSKEAGLFTWNKPSYACLATRVKTGEALTLSKLSRTEVCEDFMMGLGFSDFRIRTAQDDAIIQLKEGDFPIFEKNRAIIYEKLAAEYEHIYLDLTPR